jgi:aminoglycoside 6'-N-acetyltransferase I
MCSTSGGERVLKAEKDNANQLAGLLGSLWPEHTERELTELVLDYIESEQSAVFAKKVNGVFVGIALCSIRTDYVEGCHTTPAGYLEGVYVTEGFRCLGIAKMLVLECEQWAREKGCSEFASDCELTNTASQSFHVRIGFQEENRIVCYKKML